MCGIRFRRLRPLVMACVLASTAALADENDGLAEALESLVGQVAHHARVVGPLTGRPDLDPGVLRALGEIPRHEFLPDEVVPFAYLDVPLPAGRGLRESQPFIVAIMTDLVEAGPEDDVLILGVGGGYHAAVVSALAGAVYCLDLDEDAAADASERLERLGYGNIEVRAADPYYGWPEQGRQFDAIIIRLAVDSVPAAVLRQLRPGGRLVAPVGSGDAQALTLITREADGTVTREAILPVRFMQLPGGQRI